MMPPLRAKDIDFPRATSPAGVRGRPEVVGFWDGGDPASASCLYMRTGLCDCCGPGAYKSVPLDEMEVAILRLVLLESKEEVGKEREAVSGAEVQDAEK